MYTDQLLAVARPNELREQAGHSRLARHARGDRPGLLVRSLSAARTQLRNLTTTASRDPGRRDGSRRGATALR
jgi:hypothetical protein